MQNFSSCLESNMMAGLLPTYEHESVDEDCQPKDLSLKNNKKLKPIPPPLNLGCPSNTLKDFAIIATSPKSPLMQKNLPFRKRAYSFSDPKDNTQQKSTACPGAVTAINAMDSHTYLPSPLDGSPSPSCPVPAGDKRSHPSISSVEHPRPATVSPCWSPPTGPLSPSQWASTSVLLSPAPSSLGSSREELSGQPWPAPAWHCFQPGTLLQLEGTWRLAEQLSMSKLGSDWLGPLRVERVEKGERGMVCLSFCCLRPLAQGELVAQCQPVHTFFVRDRGWSALSPELVTKHYGVVCRQLDRGDICIPPHKVSLVSPDICDRFKRFSFPPEDTTVGPQMLPVVAAPSHIDTLLSPPASPCKKLRDPDRPKRPMNAFMLFAKRYRLELIQLHPGKDNRAISVILGEAWRKLPAGDKEVYVMEARAMAQQQKQLHPDCWKRKRSHSTS